MFKFIFKTIIDNVVFILYTLAQRVTLARRLFKHTEAVAEFQTTIYQCLWVKETTRLYLMNSVKFCCINEFWYMGQLLCNLFKYYFLNWHFDSWIWSRREHRAPYITTTNCYFRFLLSCVWMLWLQFQANFRTIYTNWSNNLTT